MSSVRQVYWNSPIKFKKVNVTSRLAAQLKQLVKANALPLITAGNISLRRSQVTDGRQKNPSFLSSTNNPHPLVLDNVILKTVKLHVASAC